MQELHNLGWQVGDEVLVDWPRTRWDHRRGKIWQLQQEEGQEPQALVVIDGIATRFALCRLRRPGRQALAEPSLNS